MVIEIPLLLVTVVTSFLFLTRLMTFACFLSAEFEVAAAIMPIPWKVHFPSSVTTL